MSALAPDETRLERTAYVRVKKRVIPMVEAKKRNRLPSRSTIMAPKMAVA